MQNIGAPKFWDDIIQLWQPFSLVSFAMGLLLVHRTTATYNRSVPPAFLEPCSPYLLPKDSSFASGDSFRSCSFPSCVNAYCCVITQVVGSPDDLWRLVKRGGYKYFLASFYTPSCLMWSERSQTWSSCVMCRACRSGTLYG